LLYDSDIDAKALEERIGCEVRNANQWYSVNGMIVNSTKHHAMVLGSTDHKFSLTAEDSLDLLGTTTDKDLNFNKHIPQVCTKVNNELSVIIRFHKLIDNATKLKLYNAFIVPNFQYSSTVWHFCSSTDGDKIETLNKRALRVVLDDHTASYNKLLDKAHAISLYNKRIHSMLNIIYKCLHWENYQSILEMF